MYMLCWNPMNPNPNASAHLIRPKVLEVGEKHIKVGHNECVGIHRHNMVHPERQIVVARKAWCPHPHSVTVH